MFELVYVLILLEKFESEIW